MTRICCVNICVVHYAGVLLRADADHRRGQGWQGGRGKVGLLWDHVQAGAPAPVRAAGRHRLRVQSLDRCHQDGEVGPIHSFTVRYIIVYCYSMKVWLHGYLYT